MDKKRKRMEMLWKRIALIFRMEMKWIKHVPLPHVYLWSSHQCASKGQRKWMVRNEEFVYTSRWDRPFYTLTEQNWNAHTNKTLNLQNFVNMVNVAHCKCIWRYVWKTYQQTIRFLCYTHCAINYRKCLCTNTSAPARHTAFASKLCCTTLVVLFGSHARGVSLLRVL